LLVLFLKSLGEKQCLPCECEIEMLFSFCREDRVLDVNFLMEKGYGRSFTGLDLVGGSFVFLGKGGLMVKGICVC